MSSICVIIPTMNRREMLQEALNSLASQTRPCDKAIVIDAGHDGSDQVCASYPFVQYVRQTTRGLTPARNEALALATEDYIGMLDSDDYYEPRFLEICGQLLDSGADVAYSQGFRVTSEGRHPILVNHRLPENVLRELVKDNFAIASFALQRRECFLKVKGYREGLALADDYDLYLRFAMENLRFAHAPMPLSNRRHHEGSLTLAAPDANLKAIQEILVYHQDVLCRRLGLTAGQLLSGSELRLGQLFYQIGDFQRSWGHLKTALSGQPTSWRTWMYLMACLTAPYSVGVVDAARQLIRWCKGLLQKLGWLEKRW